MLYPLRNTFRKTHESSRKPIKTTSLKPGDGITLMRIFYLSGKIPENTAIFHKQRVVIREGLFIFPWVTEVVDINSTSWKSKMTVNMHLFRGNKIVQMKKQFSRVFKHLYWNSSTFKSLILLLSFSSTFKDFKHLYEPCVWYSLKRGKMIFSIHWY